MIPPRLPYISAEIYRRICSMLPSLSALNLLLVNRFVYNACNDWTIWREVIRHNGDFASEHLERHMVDVRSWKRYVIADSKSHSVDEITATEVMQWLPQLIVLKHPIVSSMNTTVLASICDSIFHIPFSSTDTEPAPFEFSSDVDSSHNIQTWQLAQASAFCLTAHLLSQTCPAEPPKKLIDSVSWVQVSNILKDSSHHLKLITIQHALANRAVGYFYTHLRYVLVNGQLSPRSKGDPLPAFRVIPLSAMMEIPTPFSSNNVQEFSRCHLASILDPNFFIGNEWTGYFIASVGSTTSFNAIGGRNMDLVYSNDVGQWQGLGQFPQGRDFDSVVRFHLVEPYDANHDKYTLKSNNFYTEAELHNLTITVEKTTGRLSISHWHRAQAGFFNSEAVITPFGIVSGIVRNRYWLWMWKRNWSLPLAEAT